MAEVEEISDRLSGDAKYLAPLIAAEAKGGTRTLTEFNENLLDGLSKRAAWGPEAVKRGSGAGAGGFDRYLAWQASGDKRFLEDLYGEEIRAANQRMYMMTEGHWWSDRVEIPSELLQRSRLGGVALKRNWIWPGATVSWRFDRPDATGQSVSLDTSTTERWFNTAAFALQPIYQFGNAARNSIPGPAGFMLDSNVQKNFRLWKEHHELQFRWEAYNLLNHPVWGFPNSNLSSPTFGRSRPNSTRSLGLLSSAQIANREPGKLNQTISPAPPPAPARA